MRSTAMIGVFLVLLGVAALVYQGITYTTRETVLDLGPIQATKETTRTIPLSPLLGGAALLGGAFLIVLGAKRSTSSSH
jgi:expansin (peptidoglycan-binding protein)